MEDQESGLLEIPLSNIRLLRFSAQILQMVNWLYWEISIELKLGFVSIGPPDL